MRTKRIEDYTSERVLTAMRKRVRDKLWDDTTVFIVPGLYSYLDRVIWDEVLAMMSYSIDENVNKILKKHESRNNS